MNIRQKILFSLIGIILLMFLALGSIFVFHTVSVREYRAVSNNLILENQLSEKIIDLVDIYNSLVIAPSSSERLAAYREARNAIEEIFAELDASLLNPDSRVAFNGLRRICESILADTDAGLSHLQYGNTREALDLYNDALYKRGFVTENTTSLLLTEIRHLNEIQAQIERHYNEQLFAVGLWIFILLSGASIYSFVFARRITSPIKTLSKASKKVSEGDYTFHISDEITSRKDEVGLLARTFNSMIENLNQKITQVKKANEAALIAKNHLEDRNAELERFNKIVIGREVKMVELKRQVQTLEERIKELQGGA